MAKIGLIDVDGHNFPNLPLMKLSAFHKANGDRVEWYSPFEGLIEPYNKVYMSKVFSFSDDYQFPIYANEIEKGGTGYCITVKDGKEIFDNSMNKPLPYEIEHIYPDYSIYPEQTKNTAFGFLTRGCPRGCGFCHVAEKEGKCSIKVADLAEFWRGQKYITLLDPNILACREWSVLFDQLIESKATIDFNQGLDARLLTEEKLLKLKQIKVDDVHFAFDRYEDKDVLMPQFKKIKKITGWGDWKLIVYVLVGFKERRVIDEDLERLYFLRENGFTPFVMIYNREQLPDNSDLKKLQRWANNHVVWGSCERFEDYKTNQIEPDGNQMSINEL